MKKGKIWLGLLIFFLFEAYSIGLLLMKDGFTNAQKAGYGFTACAFVFLLLSVVLPEEGKKRIPLISRQASAAALLYFILQFAFGGVAVQLLDHMTVPMVMIPCAVLLAVYVIAALSLFAGRSHIGELREKDGNHGAFLRSCVRELEELESLAGPGPLRDDIRDLADLIRYSDPVSTEGGREIEENIRQGIASLREEMEEGMTERAQARVGKLSRLVRLRSREIMDRKEPS